MSETRIQVWLAATHAAGGVAFVAMAITATAAVVYHLRRALQGGGDGGER